MVFEKNSIRIFELRLHAHDVQDVCQAAPFELVEVNAARVCLEPPIMSFLLRVFVFDDTVAQQIINELEDEPPGRQATGALRQFLQLHQAVEATVRTFQSFLFVHDVADHLVGLQLSDNGLGSREVPLAVVRHIYC